MSDSPAIQPAETVLNRTLVLGAFVLRGLLEQNYQTDRGVLARRTSRTGMRGLKVWMEITGLIDHQSPQETTLFDHDPGEWPPDAISHASWQVEALGILLWALDIEASMPPFDTLFDSGTLLEHIPFYDEIVDFSAHSLRPDDELRQARHSAELWHWRVRTTRLQSQGFKSNEGIDLADAIADRAQQAQQAGVIPLVVDGDFPAFGTSFARLESRQFDQIAGTASIRHGALNWLCGLSDNWDTVPTHT